MEQHVLSGLRVLNRRIAIATGVILLICAAAVLLDIILRQMGASLGGTDEITGYVMALATSWGMAFTMLELGHVRIDLLRGRVARTGREVFDLFAMLVLSSVVTLIAVKAWPVLARSIANSSRANTPLETPLAWVQWPWFLGWVWFAVMAWVTLAAAFILIMKGARIEAEAAIGPGHDGGEARR